MSNKIKREKIECSTVLEKFYAFADSDQELLEVTGRNLCDYLDNFKPVDSQSSHSRQEYELRLAQENQLLIENEFSHRILAWSALNGHLCKNGCISGPGWGRFNSSLVAYLLGLGGVDPLRYGLEFDSFLVNLKSGYPLFWFSDYWRGNINAVLPAGLRMLILDSKFYRRKPESMHPWVEANVFIDDDTLGSYPTQILGGMPVISEDLFADHGLVYWSAWLELYRRICNKVDNGMVDDQRLWWGADAHIEDALKFLAEAESCNFLALESLGSLSEIIARVRPQNINGLCHVLSQQHRLSKIEDCDRGRGLGWLWWNLRNELPIVRCFIDHPLVVKNLEETGGLLLYQDQFNGLVKDITGWATEEIRNFCKVCRRRDYRVSEDWCDKFLVSASSEMASGLAEELFDFLFSNSDILCLREPFLGQALLLCSITKMKLRYPDLFQKGLAEMKA